MERVVIIGGGLAGHRAVAELKRLQPAREVAVIGTERTMPYDRTALSKAYLTDPQALVPLFSAFPALQGLSWHLDETAVGIDRHGRTVTTDTGRHLEYDKVLIATGSRPRILPNLPPGAAVDYLRTVEEAERVRRQLHAGSRLLVVGGGFIGLEVAIAARRFGCEVTLVETQDHLLHRCGSGILSAWAERLYRSQGVRLLLSTQIVAFESGPAGTEVTLERGEALIVDAILVGVGVLPNVELAENAGLQVKSGIVVDAQGGTSDPAIFAAGEVTEYPVPHLGRTVRSESWTAAGEQGAVAARALTGLPDRYDDVPWLWSDLGPHNVQCWGLPGLAARTSLVGSPDQDTWLELGYDADGTLVSAVGVNTGRNVAAVRRSVKAGRPVPTFS